MKNKSHAFLLYVIFFFSGASSLIYQIVWLRKLSLILGNTTFATSAILTTFMGGLALGSYLFGKYVDQSKHPLRLYGKLELFIGLYALIIPAVFKWAGPLFSALYNNFHDQPLLYNGLILVCCTVFMLLPAVCMGATLPLLCRIYTTGHQRLGSDLGRIYGLNTVGGALGALACGFWLIKGLGMNGSLALAVGINGLIAVFCFAAAARRAHLAAPA